MKHENCKYLGCFVLIGTFMSTAPPFVFEYFLFVTYCLFFSGFAFTFLTVESRVDELHSRVQ